MKLTYNNDTGTNTRQTSVMFYVEELGIYLKYETCDTLSNSMHGPGAGPQHVHTICSDIDRSRPFDWVPHASHVRGQQCHVRICGHTGWIAVCILCIVVP
jgi:hypothetical protein